MPLHAMLAVLAGAALHAIWNALVKGGRDKLADTVLVAAGAGLIGLVTLPFLPLPDPASWPFLGASIAIHVVYFLLVAAAYEAGDMSYAYPLMRGTAPMLVALTSAALIGETVSGRGWLGIVLISAGVLGLALDHRVHRRPEAGGIFGPTALALANAVVIALYTVVDGLGARASGHAVAYTMWMLALTAPPVVILVLLRRGRTFAAAARSRWTIALGGGACTLGAYSLALWAMTQAPVAMVAALRETSILFATAIAALVLKERIGIARVTAAGTILAGAIVMRVA